MEENLIFEFRDLINGIENLPNELLTYDSVLYRIHCKSTNKNYIGTAKYGMPSRLYDGFNGHVSLFRKLNNDKCQGMYKLMNKNIDDFELCIEFTDSPKNYDKILEMETEYIKKFDSVLFGFNVSVDGKAGWKTGTICVNNGTYDLYIYPIDLERFLNNGFKIGSCKHNFLKGTIFVNDGVCSKMILPTELERYKALGFVEGNLNIANKGRVWRNNGKSSKLLTKEQLIDPNYSEYIYNGRIEPPRKKRGKYNSPKKVKVNNGEKEILVILSDLDNFLKLNPEFTRGRLKNNNKIK